MTNQLSTKSLTHSALAKIASVALRQFSHKPLYEALDLAIEKRGYDHPAIFNEVTDIAEEVDDILGGTKEEVLEVLIDNPIDWEDWQPVKGGYERTGMDKLLKEYREFKPDNFI